MPLHAHTCPQPHTPAPARHTHPLPQTPKTNINAIIHTKQTWLFPATSNAGYLSLGQLSLATLTLLYLNYQRRRSPHAEGSSNCCNGFPISPTLLFGPLEHMMSLPKALSHAGSNAVTLPYRVLAKGRPKVDTRQFAFESWRFLARVSNGASERRPTDQASLGPPLWLHNIVPTGTPLTAVQYFAAVHVIGVPVRTPRVA